MIKNILIPENIGHYYIFPQRIIGFEINKTQVKAVQINISGKLNTTIEKFAEEKIEAGADNVEKLSSAISKVLARLDKYNYIRLSLPSYLVIFKELTFSFLDINKIRAVLDAEIEPILPYPIDEAITDFIITKQDKNLKQTTVLVAVARKKDIADLIEPFKRLNINPSEVTVDIIGLFGIYNSLPQYQSLQDGVILMDIEFYFTTIAYIQNNQLKLIRSLNQGISDLAKKIAAELNIDPNKSFENIFRLGLESENKEFNIVINKYISELITTIEFTINSFKTLISDFHEIKKIILVGQAADIKKLPEFLNNKFNINTEILNINTILQNKNFKLKEKNLPNSEILSLATAYKAPINENFNLLKKEFSLFNYALFKKNIIITGILILGIFLILIVYNQSQINKLKTEATKSKNETINILKNTFDITDVSTLKNLHSVLEEAKRKVDEDEAVWFSFSQTARFSFLKYLQELSTIIDRQGIDLKIKKLTMTNDLITIEGEVKDFKSLEILENSLSSSKLFSHISVPQETKFTIKITIKKNEEI